MSALALLVQQYPGRVFLSVAETAHATGQSHCTIRNEIALGIFPVRTIKLGRRRLIPLTDLATYLDTLTTPAPRPGRPRSSRRGV